MAEDFPDYMGDLRTWVKSVTADLLDGRAFFKFPTKVDGYPILRMHEAGGGPDGGEVPVENVRVVFDIWGKPASASSTDSGTYADVVAVVRRLKTKLHNLKGTIGGTYVLNAEVTSVVAGDDPDGGSARRIVTALLTVRNA